MHTNLDTSNNICTPEETPNTLPRLFMDHFEPVSVMGVDKILGSLKATIWNLDFCLFWLIKSCDDYINKPLAFNINQSLTQTSFAQSLKEMVIYPLL